jgi:nucleoside-diphosphate-sugar epimerase
MALHLIVGSGPVGTSVATELLARGEDVRMVTRSGSGVDGAERIAADASDAARLTELAHGAAVIYNCANPAYHRWTVDWPPIANALLSAAVANSAVLAITGNLYSYGPVDEPMTETTAERPSSIKGGVRMRMWQDALAAHRAGRIPGAVEVRGSDYVGHGPSILSMLVMPRWRKGKRAMVPADLDAPHTWTNPADMGRLLVKAAGDERGWGKVWHTPSTEAISVRDLASRGAVVAGIDQGKLSKMPSAVLSLGGVFNKQVKGFKEMNYQFQRPFILDWTATAAVFGADYTPLEESLRQNLLDPSDLPQR